MTQAVAITNVLRSHPPIVFTAHTMEGKVVRFIDREQVLGREPVVGEIWEITGQWQRHPQHGRQVVMSQAWPVRPSGRLFIQTVSGGKSFPGIGAAKAQRLWDLYGEGLYTLLDDGCPLPFVPALGIELAEVLVSGWSGLGIEANTYRWLTSVDLPPKLAEKIIAIYSGRAVPPEYAEDAKKVGSAVWHLQRDPYRMLAFSDWHSVDRAAKNMGIVDNDRRRMVGAIEAALIWRLDANHTWTATDELIKLGRRYLGGSTPASKDALSAAVDAAAIVSVGDGFELAGCEIMERFCAERLSSMAAGKFEAPQFALRPHLSAAEIEAELDGFDQAEDYALNVDQRQAVHSALLHRVSLLLGGPGVGKTTALKAIHQVAEKMNLVVHQAALSGRASQRMREATNRAALTIAALLVKVDKGEIDLGDGVMLILDECSMIDLGTLYRLLSHFKPGVRVLFVGDPGQLPPIGFGLTFHILADDPSVQKTELTLVMRQTAESGIPEVCRAIRSGKPPRLLAGLASREGVAFMNASADEIFDQMMDVLAGLGGIGSAQIIGSVKRGSVGTIEINRRLQSLVSGRGQPICGRFFVGEPIITVRNDYDIAVMNGDLGTVLGETKSGELEAEFGGRRIIIPSSYLQNVDLAYAITCHKSQGSQFEHVVIPITKSKLLDRTWLLTAVSRGQKQVFLIGDRSAFDRAIAAPPISNQRQVGLRHYLPSIGS